MGKSLYIRRLAEKLQKQCQIESQHIVVPIHGPMVNADTVMASLCNHIIGNTPTAQIIHFDIASSVSIAITLTAICIHIFVQVLSDVDTLLFSLLILKSLTDSNGQIWHCLPLQYYVIEVTYLDLKAETQQQDIFPSTMSLLEVLPTIKCVSPLEVLQNCKAQRIS